MKMFRSTRLIQLFRLLHLYTGVLITPAVLFFALTGALQTVGLHEANRDHPSYKPARWIVVLAQLHKKQTTVIPVRRPPVPAVRPVGEASRPTSSNGSAAAGGKGEAFPLSQGRNPVPLRLFFLLVSLGLFSSTLTGLALTYKYVRNKPLITALLIAGALVPLALIYV